MINVFVCLFPLRQEEARVHLEHGCLCLSNVAAHFTLSNNGAPGAVLVVVLGRAISVCILASVSVLEVELGASFEYVALFLRLGEMRWNHIALKLPVITEVAIAAITKATDFLSLAQG